MDSGPQTSEASSEGSYALGRARTRTIQVFRNQDDERFLALKDRVFPFLLRFPEYARALRLAVVHEESASGNPSYQGWQWHDVEMHPTKLIRLVTEGITRIGLRSRHATYYLLRDPDGAERALRAISTYGY